MLVYFNTFYSFPFSFFFIIYILLSSLPQGGNNGTNLWIQNFTMEDVGKYACKTEAGNTVQILDVKILRTFTLHNRHSLYVTDIQYE